MSTPRQTRKDKEEDKVGQDVQPDRPHHGLINQGATCLNSVLQVLFMTTEFHDRLDPQSNKQTDLQLRKIFEDLKKNTCRTENITTTFEIKKVYEQHDAAECLKMILHKVSCQAAKVFKGQMTHVTKCSKGHTNERTKPFWTLTLSLKDTPDTTFSVQNSFKGMFKRKTYTGDNMVPCNECNKKTGTTSRCKMVEAPQILILHLKRFNFDYNTRSHFKSHCCVEVPCELQLKNKTYKLYGMVNHMGSIRGGHYTATVLSEDNTWYECDDEHVSKVKHQLFAEDRTLSSRTVYLLTYRAAQLNMSCEMKQNEEDEVQTRNGNEVLNHLTEGEEDITEGNLNNKSEELKETFSKDSCERVDEEAKTESEEQGEQPKNSGEQHLDKETKTEKEEQRVTPPQRRHHGLINQGATCYLNSILQVLFMTTEIHNRLDKQPDKELRQIFTDLKTKTCGTENITKSLKIENVHEQSDAAECLQEILHHISEEASEVFQGQLMNTTKCSKGHIINEETNPFWTLPLSLNDSNDTTYSVESSFKSTFQERKYSSDNMVYCNDCKQKTEATSSCEMVKAPQILILLLKRFDFDYNTRSHFKSDCCVEVPCELQWKNKTYKLYGMVNHMGSLRGGHYTATVLSEDNTWYECDDSHVSEIKHQLFAEDRTLSSRTVYLLTYRATELEMSCEMRQNEEDDVQTRNDNEVLNHLTEGEEDNTEGNSNIKSEGLEETNSKTSCEPRLADKTKTERKEQKVKKNNNLISFIKRKWKSRKHPSKRAACQKPVETTSEDLTDEVKEEQGDDIGPAELKGDEEPKSKSKRNTDDEKNTQVGHSAEDDGQMREDRNEESLQAGGEEGDAENVETDTSITGNNHTTVSEVKSGEDEEAQENEDRTTREQRKSEEFKEEASVNVVEQPKDNQK